MRLRLSKHLQILPGCVEGYLILEVECDNEDLPQELINPKYYLLGYHLTDSNAGSLLTGADGKKYRQFLAYKEFQLGYAGIMEAINWIDGLAQQTIGLLRQICAEYRISQKLIAEFEKRNPPLDFDL